MRNINKILAFLLIASLALSAIAFAGTEPVEHNFLKPLPYLQQTGTISDIRLHDGDESILYVTIETENGVVVLVVDDTTYYDEALLEIGNDIIAFYPDGPVILIYPPQYRAAFIFAALTEGEFITVDYFDADLLNSGATQILLVGENTEIVDKNGYAYFGDIAEHELVVFYSRSNRMMPEGIFAEKVIIVDVLPKEARALPGEEPISPPIAQLYDADKLAEYPIIVAGQQIGNGALLGAEGLVMVPLRRVAEALGYKVEWDHDNRMLTIDDEITFVIDTDSYNNASEEGIVLGAKAVIGIGEANRTYVPLTFFNFVADAANAYIFDGEIIIG